MIGPLCSVGSAPQESPTLSPNLTFCWVYLSVMNFNLHFAVAVVFCVVSSGTSFVVSSWTPRLSSDVFSSSSATATSTTYRSFTPTTARRSGSRPRIAAATAAGGRAVGSGGVEEKYPVVLEAALELQERLRKLCADKSEDGQQARIESLAEVRIISCTISMIRMIRALSLCRVNT